MDAARPVKRRWLAWTLVGVGVTLAVVVGVALALDAVARRDIGALLSRGGHGGDGIAFDHVDLFDGRMRLIYRVRSWPAGTTTSAAPHVERMAWCAWPWGDLTSLGRAEDVP